MKATAAPARFSAGFLRAGFLYPGQREKTLGPSQLFFREKRALGWYALGVESRKGLAAWQASEWGRGARKPAFRKGAYSKFEYGSPFY